MSSIDFKIHRNSNFFQLPGVTFVHLFNEMLESPTLSLEAAFCDGLHLSKEGNKFVYDLLEPIIQDKIKHLSTMFPDWKEIDNQNTDKSISLWMESRGVQSATELKLV